MRANLDVTLDLIRHGKTARNVSSDLIGQDTEEPLNDEGASQARKLASRFKKEGKVYDYVYTSPYKRALETCKIVCTDFPKGTPITTVKEIREIFQGDGLNKSRKELYTPEFKEHLEYMGMGFKFTNGESLYEVEHRASKWLEKEIICNPFTRSDKHLNIAIFTHGMTVKCLLHHVMKFDHTITWRIDVDNTSITSLRLKQGVWFIDCINDCAHLKDLG